jgi:hypothetical protein
MKNFTLRDYPHMYEYSVILHYDPRMIIFQQLHRQSPRANYTGQATAACWRSDCQLFADRGCHVVSVKNPYGRILGFLDRSRYFSIK